MERLAERCKNALQEEGRLSQAIPGFLPRPQQIELAAAIAETMAASTTLVAEAGTGTGKTYAYLAPCLLSGKKVLISTATKTLQDQLVQKDLPVLIRALGLPTRVQNLKGRANYICRYRVALHAEEGRFTDATCAHDILHVYERIPQLTHGERNELPAIPEDSLAWPYVTSTAENCLGRECSYHANCFLMKARKRALEANIVVINHHLFFADSQLKEDGFGELLPHVEAVIFDEAHQLAEIATHFGGKRFSTRQIRDLMDDLLREWPVLDLVNQPFNAYSLQLDQCLDQLFVAFRSYEERVDWIVLQKQVLVLWDNLFLLVQNWVEALVPVELDDMPGLLRCKGRLLELYDLMQKFIQSTPTMVRWVERFKHTLVFHSTPFDVSGFFQALLQHHRCAYVFTSATLTISNSFDYFLKPLGLLDPHLLLLPSPFQYQTQAILYLPRGLPDPKDKAYYDKLLTRVIPVIEAYAGRCFFLFTSHRALREVATKLKNQLKYPLLVQGDEAKPILLNRFRELGNAVLLGTATFWEGVDVKGEALSAVIIDKLPFTSPTDPVARGKLAYLTTQGLSGFEHFSLPGAVLALKQGAGRLIRDASDRGVLIIADPRLSARPYGQQIFKSLPPMRKTRDEKVVLDFIMESQT